MSGVLAAVCIAQLVVAGLLLIRLARGPSVSDRVVALNTISTQCALGAAVTLPDAGVGFRYLEPNTLGLLAVELLLGVILLGMALRTERVARLLRWLRRLHTGSVNDYAAFAAVGMIASACALLL